MVMFGILLMASMTVSHAQSIRRIGALALVDSSGRKVGPASDALYGIATVALAVDDRIVPLQVVPSGRVAGGGLPSLLFESVDCSGTSFVISDSCPGNCFVPPFGAFNMPEPTIYVPNAQVGPQVVMVKSYRNQSFSVSSCESVGGSGSFAQTVVPAIKLVDLSTVFTPPFTLIEEPHR